MSDHAAVPKRLEMIAAAKGIDSAVIDTISADEMDVLINCEDEELAERLRGQAEMLQAIKAAHRTGGRPLSVEEAIEFITRPIHMGPSTPIPAKARGRKPTRNQYDEALARRRPIYDRLVRAPERRRSAKVARHKAGEPLLTQVGVLALTMFKDTPRHKLAHAIYIHQESSPHLLKCGKPYIRDILKALDRINHE